MTAVSLAAHREKKDERGLVDRMLAGDEAAFDTFADSYIPQLYRFARNRLRGDQDLVRDIVQTTLCKAIAKLSTFRGEAALMTWLCACCRNEIAAHFRRLKRPMREVELPADDGSKEAVHAPVADGPEPLLLRKENAELVHTALDLLPPRYSKALEWKYIEGLPVKEIAARMELGPKAAESLLTRARHSFRDAFVNLTAATMELGAAAQTRVEQLG